MGVWGGYDMVWGSLIILKRPLNHCTSRKPSPFITALASHPHLKVGRHQVLDALLIQRLGAEDLVALIAALDLGPEEERG